MIRTERLTLVPIDIKYSKDLFELWSDNEVIKYTYSTLLNTQEECIERIKLRINKYTEWNYPNNLVVLLGEKAIGIAGFPIKNHDNFEFGFYYQFIKDYWGNGYATETAMALLEYIFKNYPNATIYADAVSINRASLDVLKKIGFHQTHIEEKGFKSNGTELDLIHFKLVKSEGSPW